MRKSIRLFATVMVCMAMALCVSCKKDNAEPSGDTQTVATVTTDDVTDITRITAVCGGEVKSENGWAVTERGVCWGVEPNPTPSDNCTVDGDGIGKFTSEITGLEPGTKYYVRAYAKNAAGTGFGAERSFTTLGNGKPIVTTSSVTDITETMATCGGEVTDDGGLSVTERGVCWGTTQNPTISDSHTSDGTGAGSFTSNITGLTEGTTYYVRAYATNSNGTDYGEQRSFTTDGTINGHEYVDLGLPSGLLWATCNVGAYSPEDYGDHFSWGETESKINHTWSDYKWCNGDYNNLTKYNTNSDYGIVDNKTVLEPEDDAAHVNWGGGWRMPTRDEMLELKDNCTWTWTTQGGMYGCRVTGPSGNSIFMPAAGYYIAVGNLILAGGVGYYWSSSLNTDHPDIAYYILFYSGFTGVHDHSRICGQSVRPVCNPK